MNVEKEKSQNVGRYKGFCFGKDLEFDFEDDGKSLAGFEVWGCHMRFGLLRSLFYSTAIIKWMWIFSGNWLKWNSERPQWQGTLIFVWNPVTFLELYFPIAIMPMLTGTVVAVGMLLKSVKFAVT